MPTLQDDNIKDVITSTTQKSKNHANSKAVLHDCVCSELDKYLKDLGEYTPNNIHQLFIGEVEAPLFKAIMEHTNGNQSMAAQMLGLNRGTLRKKLKQYNVLN